MIAIITPGEFPVPPLIGSSVEISTHKLAQHMAKYKRVYVFSKKVKQLPRYEARGNRTDIRIDSRSTNFYLSKIQTTLSKIRPEWIQVENRPAYITRLKKNLPNAKIILSLHSLTFIKKLSKSKAYEALNLADYLFVNSHYIKQQILELFPKLKTPIYVNYIGVDEKKFVSRFTDEGANTRNKLRKRLGLKNKRLLLFVGRLVPQKGLHLLLKTLPSLLEKVPNAHLVIVGSSFCGKKILNTSYVQKLQGLLAPVKSHVTYLNYLPPNTIPKIYSAADIVVTPSLGQEAYCLVNIEANMSGIPVITTTVGGIPEVIRHAFNGFLIAPKDWKKEFQYFALKLLQNHQLRKVMGKNGEELARLKFSWEARIKQFLQFYTKGEEK